MDLERRGEVYRLLSRAYSAPGEDFQELPGLLKGALAVLGLNFATELERMESYFQGLPDTLGLAVEHTRLFRGPVRAEAYPYESMYIDGQIMGPSALDVVGHYGKAGLQVAEDFRDLPDHISAELEFMHYLCLQELTALQRGDQEGAARFRVVARSFLGQHLARWMPQFAERVLQSATTPFYHSLAQITREFIALETLQILTPGGIGAFLSSP